MKALFTILFLAFTSVSLSQNISKIQEIDSLLIGKKIKKALQKLEITDDNSLDLIHEPPGIIQGVQGHFGKYDFQLIVERVPYGKIGDNSDEYIIDKLKKYKIIGVAWTNGSTCNHVGRVLIQYAYNKFGDCQ